MWGPLWRLRKVRTNVEVFRQTIRALRNEYACKRGLVLRLYPLLFEDNSTSLLSILEEEGFGRVGEEKSPRTILMDMNPSLADLRAGMRRNWKRNLRVAEEARLDVVEGTSDRLFEDFVEIYKETVARKQFMEPNDVNDFRMVQAQLPEQLKMQIMICKSAEGPCAGLIWSALGEMGIELFAATSEVGLITRGSYLLRWMLVEKLKQSSMVVYNLNGINPIRNPGGYKFKSELAGKNGKDIYFLGRFDTHKNVVSYWCVHLGEKLRSICRSLGLPKKLQREKEELSNNTMPEAVND